jgi:4'-phosphopantetheinyl transferase
MLVDLYSLAMALPTEGAVDVWVADLAATSAQLEALLSPQELLRAARFASPEDGRLWARAHGILRTLLGGYLARDPLALEFDAGLQGKPVLAGVAPQTPHLHFNLSHSGSLALFAFTTAGEIGVDVELAHEGTDVLAVAARAFGPARAQQLAELAAGSREREFLKAWTRHEARLKCIGIGIGGAGAPSPSAEQGWVADVDVGQGAAGAVAMSAAPHELNRRDWPGGAPRSAAD